MPTPFGVEFLKLLLVADNEADASRQTNTTTVGADPDSDIEEDAMI